MAFLSHSQFGSTAEPSALKMREAVRRLSQRHPDLEVEGEMHADTADLRGSAGADLPELAVAGGGESFHLADTGCREHFL
ncbi:phosphate acyltransferase [Oceanibaculum nanhaiense]|uniref:phosphate acyltransferase n=1 Tax=Oceanibaculum nanhaiense TaxID=1909734 RepID=UPI003D295AE4